MTRESKSAYIELRLAPSVKQAAERAAAADQHSVTSLVEALLTHYLRSRGYLTDPMGDEGLRPDELNASNDD